jgi:hypothetical protein
MRTKHKLFLTGLVIAAGTLLAGQAQAHDDVQWSVTIGAPLPGVVVPAPVYGVPAPVYGGPVYRAPAPVVEVPVYREPHWRESRWREPSRWDRDGDGIPNRYDRVYNPRWDRDGDGVPNRRDRHPDGWARDDGRYDGRYDGRHDRRW